MLFSAAGSPPARPATSMTGMRSPGMISGAGRAAAEREIEWAALFDRPPVSRPLFEPGEVVEQGLPPFERPQPAGRLKDEGELEIRRSEAASHKIGPAFEQRLHIVELERDLRLGVVVERTAPETECAEKQRK